MKLFKKKVEIKEKIEERAEEITPPVDGVLLESSLGRTTITKVEALNIPSIQGCIKFVSDTVSLLPIKLYKELDGKVEEVKDDKRVKLLNDDTRDTLDSVQFWRALVTDYFLGKGGYAYIKREKNEVISLHYVDESQISISKNADPIFKDYNLLVQGQSYKPYDFIKILRNTKDGAEGTSIIIDNSLILSVAYQSLLYEETMVKKGGNKKGFLKAPKTIAKEIMEDLKAAFKRLYSNNSDNVVVLNGGIEFQEASNTSVEMQLNENKKSNSEELCKLFNFPISIISGKATEEEYTNAFKMGILPLLNAIQCALNKDLLLEKEKVSYYFEVDTKEMLKGSIKERFEAYKLGIDANFLQIDEVRYMENLPTLGLTWIKLGLDSVLYDVKTKTVYTPNTNQTSQIASSSTEEILK